MTLSKSLLDRQRESHTLDSNGNTVVRVVNSDSDLVIGVDYDTIDTTFPDSVTEVYTYTLSAVVVLQVQVTYTSSAKKTLLQVAKL